MKPDGAEAQMARDIIARHFHDSRGWFKTEELEKILLQFAEKVLESRREENYTVVREGTAVLSLNMRVKLSRDLNENPVMEIWTGGGDRAVFNFGLICEGSEFSSEFRGVVRQWADEVIPKRLPEAAEETFSAGDRLIKARKWKVGTGLFVMEDCSLRERSEHVITCASRPDGSGEAMLVSLTGGWSYDGLTHHVKNCREITLSEFREMCGGSGQWRFFDKVRR